jgi:hypothetical protein
MSDELGLFQRKLLIVLHKACSEIRALVMLREQQRAYDLADTVEFIPELMLHWREENWEVIRNALGDYRSKYPGSGFNYMSLMDMEDEEFIQRYVEDAASLEVPAWTATGLDSSGDS